MEGQTQEVVGEGDKNPYLDGTSGQGRETEVPPLHHFSQSKIQSHTRRIILHDLTDAPASSFTHFRRRLPHRIVLPRHLVAGQRRRFAPDNVRRVEVHLVDCGPRVLTRDFCG